MLLLHAMSVDNNDLAGWIMSLTGNTDLNDIDQQITNQDHSVLNNITPKTSYELNSTTLQLLQSYYTNYKVQNRERQKLQMQVLDFNARLG